MKPCVCVWKSRKQYEESMVLRTRSQRIKPHLKLMEQRKKIMVSVNKRKRQSLA